MLERWFKHVSVDLKKTFIFGIYFTIEFITVFPVNTINQKRDVLPGQRGQSVRGASEHEPR